MSDPEPHSEVWILSTSRLKHPRAIHMFARLGRSSSPVALLLYELSFTKVSKGALRVIVKYHCAPARTPGHLKGPRGLVKRLQTMKSITIHHVTNLSFTWAPRSV